MLGDWGSRCRYTLPVTIVLQVALGYEKCGSQAESNEDPLRHLCNVYRSQPRMSRLSRQRGNGRLGDELEDVLGGL